MINSIAIPFLTIKLKGARALHINKKARDLYKIEDSLFTTHGDLITADFKTVQIITERINKMRPAQFAISTGQLQAAGLLEEVFHLLIAEYNTRNPQFIARAYEHLQNQLGATALEKTLHTFAKHFPANKVYRGEISLEDYLNGTSDGTSHKHIVLEELLLLKLNNENPALEKLKDLFDDSLLVANTAYLELIKQLESFAEDQPDVGLGGSLFKFLRAPMQANPHSLMAQLRFIHDSYGYLLGENFSDLIRRILITLDVLSEETTDRGGFGGGPPPMIVPDKDTLFGYSEELNLDEYERFSSDSSWMPSLVLIAKSVFVWLEQLSQKYQRHIHQLNHIPDAELDELARRGFTGLWLIGVWERSPASKEIKKRMGNPDALASAYSIYDYKIAADLGGEAAFQDLRSRAWKRGIRLASDMVPNHMGIDSRWVVEHPDRFLALPEPAFPSYTYGSENLSADARVTIRIEDHYYNHSDAAVVFQRVDNQTGETRYIYHGNDGTAIPWNDTAQLNYLDESVREAIIQTILEVARRFPVIRFDAAMTLAKRHIQRLWFPQPGKGGAIPSRAQYGSLSTDEFNRRIPIEFWREVVDRVATEAPGTLLLAEAFWFMEGYFVRTLGMHRVYNSAFMHMLKNEENAKYRQSIKNILESEPEILKRFVNFMSNPDEETAVAQFGKEDKYFGVCTMMVTLPGLPMFGHGQIEGFSEKYGMEFHRANWQEQPDKWLIARHEREIFPLLHRRKQFAEVANFLLFDLIAPEGYVNEDVFAYTNSFEGANSLFVFHNKYAEVKGWLRTSASRKLAQGVIRYTLAEGLNITRDKGDFIVFKEQTRGLEFIYEAKKFIEEGFYLELKAYEYHIYLDFQQISDDAKGNYKKLCKRLQGKGVASLVDEAALLELTPLHDAYRKLLRTRRLEKLNAHSKFTKKDFQKLESSFTTFRQTCKSYKKSVGSTKKFIKRFEELLTLINFQHPSKALVKDVESRLSHFKTSNLLIWLTIRHLSTSTQESLDLADTWRLWNVVSELISEEEALFIRLLTYYQDWLVENSGRNNLANKLVSTLLSNDEACNFLRINSYQGVQYFHKESFEALIAGLWAVWVLTSATTDDAIITKNAFEVAKALEKAALNSEYRVDKLLPS